MAQFEEKFWRGGAVHGEWQGLLFLYYELKKDHSSEQVRPQRIGEIVPVNLYLGHCLPFVSVAIAGFIMTTSFDLTYSLLFVFEFMPALTMGLYALLLDSGSTDFKCQVLKSKTQMNEDEKVSCIFFFLGVSHQ